jgi:hypothetical protein
MTYSDIPTCFSLIDGVKEVPVDFKSVIPRMARLCGNSPSTSYLGDDDAGCDIFGRLGAGDLDRDPLASLFKLLVWG